MIFDWILRGGTVVDGTGTPGFLADVGILDGKIAAVGRSNTFSIRPTIPRITSVFFAISRTPRGIIC